MPTSQNQSLCAVYSVKCYHTAHLVRRRSEGEPSKQPPLSCISLPCHLCPLLKAELGFTFVIKADEGNKMSGRVFKSRLLGV